MQKNKPKLRFPEFTDAWEQRRLGEVANIIMGQSPKSENYTNNPNDYILVQGNADIKNGIVVPRVWTTQITKLAKKGDLIFSVRAPVGEIGKTNYDIVLGRGVASIKGNEFIFQLLSKLNISGFWKSVSSGSTFESINSADLKNTEIYLPTLPEQQKIGQFFSRLDSLITLHQRKLENAKKLKKSLLQKMFPKNGKDFPEIRFPEFTDAWEQRKLGEVINIYSGRDYRHLSNGNIPVYGTGGYILSVNEALSYHQDAIGIGRKGTIDKPYILNAPFWTVDTLFYAIPHRGGYNNLYFIFLIFQLINWKEKDESTGVPSLSKNNILKSISSFPTLPEQQKIGQFFSRLDSLITLHQRKLDNMQKLKKSLLQQMFV